MPCRGIPANDGAEQLLYNVYGMRKVLFKGQHPHKPRLPGADVVKPGKRHLDEAYLVHGIIIIFLFVMEWSVSSSGTCDNFVRSIARSTPCIP